MSQGQIASVPSSAAHALRRAIQLAFAGWRQRKADQARHVRKGFAAQLLWTMAEHGTSIEDIADRYGSELYCDVGPPEADSPATLLGFAIEESRAVPRDRPLAWLLSAGSTGTWACAYEIASGEWWTLVCAGGRLLPGPATDKIHADADQAVEALRKEIEEALRDNDPIRKIYATRSLGLASAQCEEIPDTLEAALKRVAQLRKSSGQGLLSRKAKLPRMVRTRAAEYFKRQIAIGGLGAVGISILVWAFVQFVDFAQLQQNVAPPPPPPPPPPWMAPVPRLVAPAWLRICEDRTRALRYEVPGWELETLECNDTVVRGRWKRRAGLAPFNTLSSFESYWARNAASGVAIAPESVGDAVAASLPFATPAQRAAFPAIVPEMTATQIVRRVWTESQRHGIRIDLKSRQQLPTIPNARTVYFSHAFQSEFEDMHPLDAWAVSVPVPGMSIRTAVWRSKDRIWTISGEIFERN